MGRVGLARVGYAQKAWKGGILKILLMYCCLSERHRRRSHAVGKVMSYSDERLKPDSRLKGAANVLGSGVMALMSHKCVVVIELWRMTSSLSRDVANNHLARCD
ncbi:hypothetical protein CDAR_583101 [Caerostris darwini]|uniref:Uncharacterized protein n=1 Tax=Caerostris darwini TaxID=1538125 RepID=A0AAV4P840_9ARAC|nr:hypothetical protein CDAR_583101 [Caerostris darwini]